MRVYHFLNEKYGLEDLKRRRLKIAFVEDLNDPFEILGFASRDSAVRAGLSLAKQDFGSKFGMLCFSRNWHNPVLWSHYADGHRGICLGFDVPRSLLVVVRYESARILIASDTVAATNAMHDFRRLISTKFEHWKYEDEARMLIPLSVRTKEGRFYYEYFSPGLRLREIIVGHRSSLKRSDLKQFARSRDVLLARARLAFQSFKVVKQRDQKLW
jgi:hypothetical protein